MRALLRSRWCAATSGAWPRCLGMRLAAQLVPTFLCHTWMTKPQNNVRYWVCHVIRFEKHHWKVNCNEQYAILVSLSVKTIIETCVCMYECMCMYVYVYVYVYVWVYVHVCVCICVSICVCVLYYFYVPLPHHTYTYIHTHSCMHAYMHTYIRACTHAPTHPSIHTYISDEVRYASILHRIKMLTTPHYSPSCTHLQVVCIF